MVSQVVMGALHLDHNLYGIDGLPRTPYSDMNGYGHFMQGWSWFALYWSLFTVACLILAQAFWVRGLSSEWRVRVREAGRRLKGSLGAALALCVIAFAGVGGWIFHNTNTLAHYEASDVAMDKRAQYEKTLPQIQGRAAAEDHGRARRTWTLSGAAPRDDQGQLRRCRTRPPSRWTTLRLQLNPRRRPPPCPACRAHKVELDDKKLGFQVIKLAEALAPGARLPLDFTVEVRRPGFTNGGDPDTINFNGTFFNNHAFFPLIGYQTGQELTDRNERRKRGLGEPVRMAKLEDQAARANTVFGAMPTGSISTPRSSTSPDQIALAPGYLQTVTGWKTAAATSTTRWTRRCCRSSPTSRRATRSRRRLARHPDRDLSRPQVTAATSTA